MGDVFKWWGVYGGEKDNSLWRKYIGQTVIEYQSDAFDGANFADPNDNLKSKKLKVFIEQEAYELNVKKPELKKVQKDDTGLGDYKVETQNEERTEAFVNVTGWIHSDTFRNERLHSNEFAEVNSNTAFGAIGPSISLWQKEMCLLQMAKNSGLTQKERIFPLRLTLNWNLTKNNWNNLLGFLQGSDYNYTYAEAREKLAKVFMPHCHRNWSWNDGEGLTKGTLVNERIPAERTEIIFHNAMIDNMRIKDDASHNNRKHIDLTFLVNISVDSLTINGYTRGNLAAVFQSDDVAEDDS